MALRRYQKKKNHWRMTCKILSRDFRKSALAHAFSCYLEIYTLLQFHKKNYYGLWMIVLQLAKKNLYVYI